MSGTTISNLPSAGSVPTTNLLPTVLLGTPNVTQRATVTQLLANALTTLAGQTIAGTLSATNGATGTQVVNFSQFNPTAAASGVIHFPGGVTLQWGTAAIAGSSYTVVAFGYVFSGTPWLVMFQPYDTTTAQPWAVGQGPIAPIAGGASVFGYNTSSGAQVAIPNSFWVAIGPT